MAEKYAPEAPVKDARVQEFAYAEMKVVDATVKETATEYSIINIDIALKSGNDLRKVKEEDKFVKPNDDELKKIEDASRTV